MDLNENTLLSVGSCDEIAKPHVDLQIAYCDTTVLPKLEDRAENPGDGLSFNSTLQQSCKTRA